MKSKKHLFLYTIGPVQSFIAQARKTQDLWGGSTLLSELLRNTALHARKEFSANIIFPAIDDDKTSMPNRFLAFIDSQDISKVGKALKDHTHKLLQEKAKQAVNGYNKPPGYDEQIKQFLQIHWAALSCDEEQYPDKFDKIEQMLAAVKNTRIFEPLHEPVPGRKCSLCGERVALFYDERDKPQRFVPGAVSVANYKLTNGEGLDAVGFLKRSSKTFPSTAKIALSDTLIEFQNHLDFEIYKKLFHFGFDAQLYYEENLTDDYFKKHGIDGNLSEAKKLLKKMYAIAAEQNHPFKKYYAIVLLDGDNVGAWLSGGKLDDQSNYQKLALYEYHQHVTTELAKYAVFVDDLFNNNPQYGAKVYCGGDDVLAFVNLGHLTSVLSELRSHIPDFDGTGRFTASAGVVIAHYKIPLSEVLKWVRIIEKEAKQRDDEKNRLALAVLKHSGEIEKCVLKWRLADNLEVLDVLQKLRDAWQNKLLSVSFVRSLIRTFYILLNKDGEYMYGQLVETELKRAVKRSALKDGKTGKGEKEVEALIEQLTGLLQHGVKLQDFLSFLSIADFMERKVEAWS